MEIGSVATLVGELKQCQLLEPPQLDEVSQTLQPRFNDARALAGQLLKQGWLTPYQVNQLFQGRGGELVLGPYLLLERLGDGGMGQVFKARHRRMKRLVDLVVLAEELLVRPEAQQRFYQEIQAASQLSHPNIVTAYDAGPAGRTHFVALEHVDGTDFERLVLEGGALEVAQACNYVRQAALGLQHGFERGLLHHDFRPANLIATRTPVAVGDGTDSGTFGPLKIRNLGLTFLRQPTRSTRSQAPEGGLVVAGSPDYAAPEQFGQGQVSDVRSEIYSLGCVFYFLLTARVPFPGGDSSEKLTRHQTTWPVPVETYRSDVPAEVIGLLYRLLAKDPVERFQTPADVADALDALPMAQAIQTSETIALEARPAARPATDMTSMSMRLASSAWAVKKTIRERRWLWLNIAGGLTLLLLLGGFLLLLNRSESGGGENAASTTKPGKPPDGGNPEVRARAELDTLLPLLDDKQADKEHLRARLLALRASYPATTVAREVPGLLMRLPSAFDGLDETAVPSQNRPVWLPKDVTVGVLGEYPTGGRPTFQTYSLCPSQNLVTFRGNDNNVQVLNILSSRMVVTAKSPPNLFPNLAVLAPNGKSLAITYSDSSIHVWDLATTGQERCVLPSKAWPGQNALAFSPDGQSLAHIQSNMQSVKCWDISTATPKERGKELTFNGVAAYAVAYAPDGKTLAVACADRSIRLFDLVKDEGTPRLTIPATHPGIAQSLLFSPEGKTLASLANGQGQFAKVWDSETGKLLATVEKPQFMVNNNHHALAFSPDGQTLAVTGQELVPGMGWRPTILLWDVAQNAERLLFKRFMAPYFQVQLMGVGPGARTVTTWSPDNTLRLWDAGTAQERLVIKAQTSSVGSIALSPTGQTLAAGSPDGWVTLWDVTSGKRHTLRGGHDRTVRALAFSPDGQTLATAGFDQAVRLWDVNRRGDPQTLSNILGYPTALAYAPEGTTLAVGNNEGVVTLWDPATRKQQGSLDGMTGWVNALAYSPDGKTLAAAGSDGMVRLWGPSGGRWRNELPRGIGGEATALAFSPDGQTVAVAGSAEPNLRLCQLNQGKTPTLGPVVEGHAGAVRGVAFSPDGKWLASVGDDCNVMVTKVGTGKPPVKWVFGVPVKGVTFAPDGRHIVTLNDDGTAYVLRLTHSDAFKEASR